MYLCLAVVVSFRRTFPHPGKRLVVPNGELRRGAHLAYVGLEPVGGKTTKSVARPVRRQSYCHLPSLRASPPFDRYQVIQP